MWSYRHETFTVHQLPALRDNYIYLIESGDALACVDPAEDAPVNRACKELGRGLTHILNTHHHWDHTDANLALKARHGCEIVGFAGDAERIPGLDRGVGEEEVVALGDIGARVMVTPGHTRGHVCYLIDDALFCGDTLFGAGCGRLFEGTPEMMWNSLEKLMQLPEETRIYCAHEYTVNNLEFCMARISDDERIRSRLERARKLRERGEPTVPSTMGEEMRTNPMLLPADSKFRRRFAATHGLPPDPLSVFTHIRRMRDAW